MSFFNVDIDNFIIFYYYKIIEILLRKKSPRESKN